jgi:hypothetical protein
MQSCGECPHDSSGYISRVKPEVFKDAMVYRLYR